MINSNCESMDHLPEIIDFTPDETRTSSTKVMVTLSSNIDSIFDNKKSNSSWMTAIVFVRSDSDGCDHFEQTVIAPSTQLAPFSFKGVFDWTLRPSDNSTNIFSEGTTNFRIALVGIKAEKSAKMDNTCLVGNFLEKSFNNRPENDFGCFGSVQLLSKFSTDFFIFKDGVPQRKTLPRPPRRKIFAEKSFQSKRKRGFSSTFTCQQNNTAHVVSDEKLLKYDRKCKIRIVEMLRRIVFATKNVTCDTIFQDDSRNSILYDDTDNEIDHSTRTCNNERHRERGSILLYADLQCMDDDILDSTLDMLVIELVESLVSTSDICGAQEAINNTDSYGFTLLHYASLCSFQILMPVLLTHGAIPDLPTVNEQLTPLHLACSEGNRAGLDLLVRNGCSINVRDSDGNTPSDHALRNGHSNISKVLQKIMWGDNCPEKCRRLLPLGFEKQHPQKYNGGDRSDVRW